MYYYEDGYINNIFRNLLLKCKNCLCLLFFYFMIGLELLFFNVVKYIM